MYGAERGRPSAPGDEGVRRGPNKAVLEITRACNMSCLHCASAAGRVRPHELSTQRMLTLIDELHEMGVEDMVFSGGEPLVRKDWTILAARVREHGMSLGMVSNGTFALKNMDHIRRYLTAYSMSLDGLEETHNLIRNSPRAFSDMVQAFRELAEHDVYRFAVTSLSKLNLHQLEGMYRLLVDHDVVGWQVQLVFPSGRMRGREQLLCDPEDLFQITEFLAGVRDEGLLELHTGDNIGYYTSVEDLARGFTWQGCQAGLSLISVEADGNVKGCLCQEPELRAGKKFVEGNVNERPVAEIWQDDQLFAYNRHFDPAQARGFCASCRYLKQCRCGCTAFAHYLTGTKYDNPYCVYRLMATT
ncbi:MAG: radical SAM protein [Candidatus Eremiobacterota bacterium]